MKGRHLMTQLNYYSRVGLMNRALLFALLLVATLIQVGCVSTGTQLPAEKKSLDAILRETAYKFDRPRSQTTTRRPRQREFVRREPDHYFGAPRPGVAAQPVFKTRRHQSHRLASFQGFELLEGGRATVIPSQLPRPSEGLPVSDTFIESDLRQAIQSIATQAKVDVVLGDDVHGVADAVFQNEPFERALRRLLTPAGCVFRKSDGTYLIGTTDPESEMFPLLSGIYEYRTMHTAPENLVKLLPARQQRFVRISDTSNLIVIEAPEQTATRILQSLKYVDRAPPQVDLTVMVCVYSPETNFRFGFDMEHGVNLTGEAASVALSGLSLSGAVGPSGVSALNNFTNTSLVLKALQQEGYLSIKASPSVMARDGEKATIQIGRESYFSVQQAGVTQIFRNDIERVESGIMLDLTPTIRGNRVAIRIDRAEVSEDIRTGETTGNGQFPVINRRRVSTSVHVNDGETVVIGGLKQNQVVDSVSKFPLLGDIPLAGHLFRRIEKQNTTSEIAIFISPRIVRTEEYVEEISHDQPLPGHRSDGCRRYNPPHNGELEWSEPAREDFR